MAGLTEKISGLNTIPLDQLQARIDALRAQAEADLKRASATTDKTATPTDTTKAAQSAGLSTDEFMTALERAKKMGLI